MSNNKKSPQYQDKKGSPIVKPSYGNDNYFGIVSGAQADRQNWLIRKLKSTVAVTTFVGQTFGWGVKETLNFKKNWIVENHDQQHGLDDGRSEMSHALSGVVETLGTGNFLPAVGRISALSFDLLHSVNLVRHSEGYDYMKDKRISLDLPDFVKNRIDGTVDAQSLSFKFSKNANNWKKTAEVFTDEYNRWLLVNKGLNLKMFPNAAGRTAEVTTGLGFLIVGTLIANQNGVDTSAFDQVRGYTEAAIGAGGLAAAVVDIMITESEEDSDVEVGDHSQFINAYRVQGESAVKSILQYIPRTLATMYNENQILKMFSELQSEESSEKFTEFENDFVLQNLLVMATKRREKSSSLANAFRGVVGSAVGDFKELGDHFKDVAKEMKKSDASFSVLLQDLKSQPARYGGAAQMVTAQLYLPLAGMTAIWGAAVATSPVVGGVFLASGAAMGASWFFAHRGYAAKSKMSLLGVEVSGNGSKPSPY